MRAEWIKTLDNGRLFVDLNALPPPLRSLRGACFLVIPQETKGLIKCYCDVSSCRVDEFWFQLEVSEEPFKLTPAELHCPLCSCQARCFEFEGRTREDARKVAKSNQMGL